MSARSPSRSLRVFATPAKARLEPVRSCFHQHHPGRLVGIPGGRKTVDAPIDRRAHRQVFPGGNQFLRRGGVGPCIAERSESGFAIGDRRDRVQQSRVDRASQSSRATISTSLRSSASITGRSCARPVLTPPRARNGAIIPAALSDDLFGWGAGIEGLSHEGPLLRRMRSFGG